MRPGARPVLAEFMNDCHRSVVPGMPMLLPAGLLARLAVALLAAVLLAGAAPADAQRFERGLLWRVEGKGTVNHVFGTIHLADPRVTQLPPPVAQALNAARSLSVEVGFDPANLVALAGRMVFLDGRDLPGAVGPELYARVAELTGPLGVPEQALRLFRPWAIALLLSVPRQDPQAVLDNVLAATARAQGKPVHELETVEEQVAVFEGLGEDDQVLMLRRAADEHARVPQTVDRMVQAYLARDLALMRRIGEEIAAGDAEAMRLQQRLSARMLDERNVRMVERMLPRLQEGGAFVAVGALHLYGERGVLAGLAQRGWRVTLVY